MSSTRCIHARKNNVLEGKVRQLNEREAAGPASSTALTLPATCCLARPSRSPRARPSRAGLEGNAGAEQCPASPSCRSAGGRPETDSYASLKAFVRGEAHPAPGDADPTEGREESPAAPQRQPTGTGGGRGRDRRALRWQRPRRPPRPHGGRSGRPGRLPRRHVPDGPRPRWQQSPRTSLTSRQQQRPRLYAPPRRRPF